MGKRFSTLESVPDVLDRANTMNLVYRLVLLSGILNPLLAANLSGSLWPNTATPTVLDVNEGQGVELGLKFRATVAGQVTGVRFYKNTANTGTHVGTLWSGTGTPLATVTFAGETASGWQTASFATPVSITANTTYVVSYHSATGHFSYNAQYFTAARGGYYNAPLLAVASGVDGLNGVYLDGPGAFPNQSYQDSNYWVDVVFAYPDTGATTSAPAAVTIETGTLKAGTFSALTTDDTTYYQVSSTTSGTRTTAWYATFHNVSRSTSSLAVAYKGSNSAACTEVVSIYNWSSAGWSALNSQSVGSTEVLRAALSPPPLLSAYVSGTAATGDVRVEVKCTAAANFSTNANLMTLSVGPSTAPLLTITSPAAGQTVYGTTVTTNYTASGDLASVGADHAVIILDANPGIASPLTAPSVQLTGVSAGSHVLSGYLAKVDNTQITGTDAAPISFITIIPQPPTVSITAPASGAMINGTTTVTASATSNVGVASVQFLIDSTNLGAAVTSSPYSTTLNPSLYTSGTHALTAVVKDILGTTATSSPVSVTVVNPSDPSQVGQWSAPVNWPVVAVNAVLLHTGKVLAFEGVPGITSGSVNGGVWDPTTGLFTTIQDPANDIFCSGQTVMADGRVLVIGGHNSADLGSNLSNIFDPVTQTWSNSGSMAFKRWYPSGTTLPDGRVLATSGAQLNEQDYVPIPEIYNPITQTWTKLTAANLTIPTYPHMYVLGDGSLAYVGNAESPSPALKLNVGTQLWTTIDPTLAEGGSSVQYAPGKFLKTGSANDQFTSNPAAATSFVINFNDPTPHWQQTASMAFPRVYHNLTLLPDGNVMVFGGVMIKNPMDSSPPVLQAEMWSPASQTWTTMSKGSVTRSYHSTAVLLADGRILIAGSGRDSGFMSDQRNYEVYSPPYLFKGARPTVTSVPGTVQYGSGFFVGTPDAASVTSVVLMRPASVTHMFDMEQRRIPLSFTATAGGLTVQAPANSNLAPPGYYMVMILNGSGVPSVGQFVRFPAPFEDTVPPTAPSHLVTTGGIGTAALTWTAATDNVGVTQYNIHRSTTATFTPSAANRVGQSLSTQFTDSGLAGGRYYYLVTAQDGAGNVGPSSNLASADVTLDLVPPTVSLVTPASGATLSASVTFSANASDDVAVAGVQFLVDGATVGAEIAAPPYTYAWNSTTVLNGAHQIAARARDSGGNSTTSTAAAVTVSNTVTSGLVAAYGFNETSTTAVTDGSGNQNNGSISGAVHVTGKYGNGLQFNGTNSMVTINDSPSLDLKTGMTLEAWVNPTATGAWICVITKETVGDNVWSIYSSGNNGLPGVWAVIGNSGAAAVGTALPLDTWTHLAATFDGTTLRFYMNAVLKSSSPATGSLPVTSQALRIGGDVPFGEYFKGIIDEVRVYNRALSQAEILNDMNTPIVP